jgi:hypothetical protein
MATAIGRREEGKAIEEGIQRATPRHDIEIEAD